MAIGKALRVEGGKYVGAIGQKEKAWTTLATGVRSADLSSVDWEEADIIQTASSGGYTYGVTFHIDKYTPSGYYYNGSIQANMVAGVIIWDSEAKTITYSDMWIGGQSATGSLKVVYK